MKIFDYLRSLSILLGKPIIPHRLVDKLLLSTNRHYQPEILAIPAHPRVESSVQSNHFLELLGSEFVFILVKGDGTVLEDSVSGDDGVLAVLLGDDVTRLDRLSYSHSLVLVQVVDGGGMGVHVEGGIVHHQLLTPLILVFCS